MSARAPRAGAADVAEDATHGSVQAISAMIKDLEVQLDRMVSLNTALEGDLEAERKKAVELRRSRDDLREALRRAEWDAAGREDLAAEIDHLKAERSRLAESVDSLKERLAEATRAREKAEREAEQLRAGRANALEELEDVEAQFERAMEIVSDHKTRLAVLTEEYDALRGRLKITADSLAQTEQERDALLTEVEESRVALEEIRRSLVDACVVSQYHKVDSDDR